MTKAESIKAKHPILNIIYNGYEIDMQPAKMVSSTINRQLDWLDSAQFEECSLKSKAVLAAITTNARVKKMMEDLGQFQVF